jgi:hypothetical protein
MSFGPAPCPIPSPCSSPHPHPLAFTIVVIIPTSVPPASHLPLSSAYLCHHCHRRPSLIPWCPSPFALSSCSGRWWWVLVHDDVMASPSLCRCGGGGGRGHHHHVHSISSSPSPSLPISTPRAVACGGSWGCCGGMVTVVVVVAVVVVSL